MVVMEVGGRVERKVGRMSVVELSVVELSVVELSVVADLESVHATAAR